MPALMILNVLLFQTVILQQQCTSLCLFIPPCDSHVNLQKMHRMMTTHGSSLCSVPSSNGFSVYKAESKATLISCSVHYSCHSKNHAGGTCTAGPFRAYLAQLPRANFAIQERHLCEPNRDLLAPKTVHISAIVQRSWVAHFNSAFHHLKPKTM